MRSCLRSALPLLLFALPSLAHGGKPKPQPDRWIATWSATETALPAASVPAEAGQFVPGFAGTTIREIVQTSIPTGPATLVRLRFTNRFGTDPLNLAEVHVALADPQNLACPQPIGDLSLVTANALTFAGASSVTIPAGAEAVSDPIALTLPAKANLVVSIYLPAQTIATATYDLRASQASFFAAGNVVSQRSLAMPATQFRPTRGCWFLSSVEILVPAVPAAKKK